MARSSKLLDDAGKNRVETAIAAAETKTSGELVVCLATRSGNYDRGEDLFGVLLALVAVAAAWILFQDVTTDGWGTSIVVGLVPLLLVFAVVFSLGAGLATLIPPLGTFFTTRAQMQDAVEDRARIAFHEFGVRGTRAATGILVYVSLLERMVWVLGDDQINESIEQSQWDAIRDAVVDGLRRNAPDDGLVKAVELAGELLAKQLPGSHDDIDELSNHLRIVD